MRGNLHVRFLGEGVAARRPPYPTVNVGSIPITRSSPGAGIRKKRHGRMRGRVAAAEPIGILGG